MMALLRLPAWILLILAMLSQLIVLPVIKGDDDGAALLDFIHTADPANAFSKQWVNGKNSTDDYYCKWPGVLKCENKRVVTLFLQNIGLNGTIVPDFFSRLDKLRILSLRGNKLGGTIPDLSGSQSLHTLLLDRNDLTGLIPNSLGQLPSLKTIGLSNNYLSGSLPDSPNFNTLSFFDVSYNDLSGPIPQSLSHNNASSFEGNVGLCGQPLIVKCRSEGLKRVSLIIHVVLGAVVGIVLILVGLLCFRRRKGQEKLMKSSPYSDNSGGKSTNSVSKEKAEGMKKKEMSPTVHPYVNFFTQEAQGESIDEKGELVLVEEGEGSFKLEDLLKASAMIVGRGILGTSYKATLEGGLEVVVKRLRAVNHCGRSAFLENMATIGRARHPNILPLRAHFYGKEEKLLIYHYIPHGSLFNALHSAEGRRNTPLDWTSRVKIARGVASALDYIHTSLSSSPACKARGEDVLHGNLKSTNILLGPNMEALVADFGMASMLANTAAQSYMAGHRAPECCKSISKKLTQSVDTYSYGVLLLELLTGQMPLQATIAGDTIAVDQGVDLPAWVESVVKQEWTAEVFDRALSLSKTEEDELVALLRIAMACVSPKLEQRPTMAHVLQSILEDMKSLEDHDMQALEASLNVGEGHGFHDDDDDDDDDNRSSLQLDADHSAMDMPNYSCSFSFDDQVSRISNITF